MTISRISSASSVQAGYPTAGAAPYPQEAPITVGRASPVGGVLPNRLSAGADGSAKGLVLEAPSTGVSANPAPSTYNLNMQGDNGGPELLNLPKASERDRFKAQLAGIQSGNIDMSVIL